MIINRCFTAAINYHDFFHGFEAGRDTGTATLDLKLIQQVPSLREQFLNAIFLELHKVCDALDRSRCLSILECYGVGPRALHLL